jgi:hypothetical protein
MLKVAATLHCWCRDLKVSDGKGGILDFTSLLKLKGGRRAMYLGMAMPLAEVTIAKGGTPTQQEIQNAMATAQMRNSKRI